QTICPGLSGKSRLEQTASGAGASGRHCRGNGRQVRRGVAPRNRARPAMIIFKFSLLDWLILAILIYSIAVSWFKGFIREVLGLITVLAAVLLAAWFYRGVGDRFKDVVRTENIALFLGFSLIFLA